MIPINSRSFTHTGVVPTPYGQLNFTYGNQLLSATLILPGAEAPLADAGEIRAALERVLDVVLDSGSCGTEPSTVIDLTGDAPVVLRKGKGSLESLGLAAPL